MIRRARPADRAALYEICLRTGDGGSDATARFDDPALLGHVYLGPYLELDDLAFVVTADGSDGAAAAAARGDGSDGAVATIDLAGQSVPLGYCVGTADTERFARACEDRWWPSLRRAYPLRRPRRAADQELVELIHHPPHADASVLDRFPGHLHIDLLPAIQGRGVGAPLVARFVAALVQAGCPGVHLGVATGNARAIGFYRRVGFTDLAEVDGTLLMGRDLRAQDEGTPDPGPVDRA